MTELENERIEPLVELVDVSMRSDRGESVFRDLTLDLLPGRSVVITGSSGSGKTMLGELLIGLRIPQSGKIRLFGHDLSRRKRSVVRRVRLQIGGVGGQFRLVPSLTVAQNISLPMVIAGERKKIRQERLRKMLAEFSLLRQAGEYPGSLTRVENTLVLLARASVANQPLMIIDEPLAGLDQKTFSRVADFLAKVSISGRSMIILASDPLPVQLPNSEQRQIVNGALV
ncbi:MAG: ATP-binding cassette domain-containing protein [Candidatus Zixiibacteriota bacterium]|nr:MAG: ATP-binding cassette domain-containing protein [candidate division Zixibacteria bacterium]